MHLAYLRWSTEPALRAAPWHSISQGEPGWDGRIILNFAEVSISATAIAVRVWSVGSPQVKRDIPCAMAMNIIN